MLPAAPLIVHPSWVQTASTAVKALALVRATRNTPAMDSTSAAPSTVASADPLTLTWTAEPANRPDSTSSFETGPLPGAVGEVGDVGDDPSQAETSVASVAQDASWQAPAQNRRRETGVC